ncbi:MAG: hypothetical protein NC191_02815 [Muribaculaceae bacterium]|nr:hypothetical protein [Muribaculaceae bacterium]
MHLSKKVLFLSVMILISAVPAFADEYADIMYPKSPAYRVGLSEIPETQYVQAQQLTKVEKNYTQIDGTKENNIADRTYADLSIKNLSREVAQDLEFEEQEMLSDLSLLWQGAAMQSDTINFALYKLANPDADKPDEKSVKNVLKTIASMSTLVGASMGNPILAGSSLIGGNIFGIMSQDTKALNYKYTRVTDADMIILIRKIEDLQQNAVNLYYDYMCAKKHLDFTTKLVDENRHKFELAQKNNASRELVVITDAYYRTALDKQRTAKAEFFAKRAALEQFVGHDTFVQFEEELIARENSENSQSNENSVGTNPDENQNKVVENSESEKSVLNNVESFDENAGFPKLRPVDINPENATEFGAEGFMTGLSSNIGDIEDDVKFSKSVKKSKKEKSKNKVKPKKEKKFKEKNISPAKAEKLEAKQKLEDEKLKAKEKSLEEKRRLEEKRKNPTKGLIFLHGQDKSSVKSNLKQPAAEEVSVNSSSEINQDDLQPLQPIAPTIQSAAPNPYGLPPLDEIRVPDLTRGGYSIHSELSY